jgi:hypothetical protein
MAAGTAIHRDDALKTRLQRYCGNGDARDYAIAKFALAYARQTDQDCEALDKARRTGRPRAAAREVVK